MLTSKTSTVPVLAAAAAAAVAAPAEWVPGAVAHRVIAREAIILGLLVAGFTAVFAPGDLGAGLHPHPGWAAVILLSARYCSRGFAFALVAIWGGLALTSLCMGLGMGPLATMSNSAADLVALVVSVLVAWIASTHERRIGDLTVGLGELARHKAEGATVITALREAALALRARADRFGNSMTFLRDVAGRLESGDPLSGSQAALELAIARTGARAGIVQIIQRRRLRTFASLGAWTLQTPTPPDLFTDATIRAAHETGFPVVVGDLPEPGRDDSDVAVPIADRAGKLLGVLALRGVPADSLCHALVHDLALIAQWCAKSSDPARVQEIDTFVAPHAVGQDPLVAPFAWDAPTMPALRIN